MSLNTLSNKIVDDNIFDIEIINNILQNIYSYLYIIISYKLCHKR